ncbi:MAG: hypothetical protein ACR2NP_07005 [Pirellulaceae bacterium]
MTDSLTLDPGSGQIGHLRLHAPTPLCPYRETANAGFPNFDRLNVAFQQATGWKLGWYETADSNQSRKKRGRPDYPAAGILAIDDLSTLMPPGIPSASRIYCEKLVDELNETLAELHKARVALWQQNNPAPAGHREPANNAYRRIDQADHSLSVHQASISPINTPFQDQQLGITSLVNDLKTGFMEWYADEQGNIRLLLAVCRETGEPNQSALLTARTTFLAECRHQSPELEIEVAIRETLERMFPEVSLDLVSATLHRLSGQFSMTGDHRFRLDSTAMDVRIEKVSGGTRLTHLARDQHLFISHWPTAGIHSGYQDEVDEWWWTSIRELRQANIESLAPVFGNRLKNSIPSLLLPPNLAMGLSR